jgi:hypothetical protein
MNHELSELIGNADKVRCIKIRRIAWLGHVMWMDGKGIPTRVLEWKPTGRRIRGRPRERWIEDVEEDIQLMGIRGWRKIIIIIISVHHCQLPNSPLYHFSRSVYLQQRTISLRTENMTLRNTDKVPFDCKQDDVVGVR